MYINAYNNNYYTYKKYIQYKVHKVYTMKEYKAIAEATMQTP